MHQAAHNLRHFLKTSHGVKENEQETSALDELDDVLAHMGDLIDLLKEGES